MQRITREEAKSLILSFAFCDLFKEKDKEKLEQIADCINAEIFGKDIWGKNEEEVRDWADDIEE